MFAESADALADRTHSHSKILADQEPLIDFFRSLTAKPYIAISPSR